MKSHLLVRATQITAIAVLAAACTIPPARACWQQGTVGACQTPLAAARRDEARARSDAETGDPGGAMSAADAADAAALDAVGTPDESAAQDAARAADDAAAGARDEELGGAMPASMGGGGGW